MSISFNGWYRILRPMTSGTYIATMLILIGDVVNATAKDDRMLKLALKQQRELRLAITVDVSILLAGRVAGGRGQGRLPVHTLTFIYFLISRY